MKWFGKSRGASKMNKEFIAEEIKWLDNIKKNEDDSYKEGLGLEAWFHNMQNQWTTPIQHENGTYEIRVRHGIAGVQDAINQQAQAINNAQQQAMQHINMHAQQLQQMQNIQAQQYIPLDIQAAGQVLQNLNEYGRITAYRHPDRDMTTYYVDEEGGDNE